MIYRVETLLTYIKRESKLLILLKKWLLIGRNSVDNLY